MPLSYINLQINNPDKRIEILKDFVLDPEKFKQETPLLEYALKVEKITTSKVYFKYQHVNLLTEN